MLKYKKAGNSAAGIKAMDESRAAVDELGLGKEKAFIFTIRMASWESDKVHHGLFFPTSTGNEMLGIKSCKTLRGAVNSLTRMKLQNEFTF